MRAAPPGATRMRRRCGRPANDEDEFPGAGPDELTPTAARECPTEAITIVDSETGQQVFRQPA
jgi:hypothetical protein